MKFFLALTLLAAVALAATCDTEKKAYDDAKTAVDKEEIADIKAELQKEADAKKKSL
jgi:Arc/MetJ family transcription regulator